MAKKADEGAPARRPTRAELRRAEALLLDLHASLVTELASLARLHLIQNGVLAAAHHVLVMEYRVAALPADEAASCCCDITTTQLDACRSALQAEEQGLRERCSAYATLGSTAESTSVLAAPGDESWAAQRASFLARQDAALAQCSECDGVSDVAVLRGVLCRRAQFWTSSLEEDMHVWSACTAEHWALHEVCEAKLCAAVAALRALTAHPAPQGADANILVQCFTREKDLPPPRADSGSPAVCPALCIFLEQWLAWHGMRARAAAWAADVEPFWLQLLEACAPHHETVAALARLPGHVDMQDACGRLGTTMSASTLLEMSQSVG